MGNKINNTAKYPKIPTAEILNDFILLASKKAGSGDTVNLSILDLLGIFASVKFIKVTLTSATSYQDNQFLDKSFVSGFVSGQEILTGGLISAFDPDTGTVTFDAAFGAISGEVIFVTQA